MSRAQRTITISACGCDAEGVLDAGHPRNKSEGRHGPHDELVGTVTTIFTVTAVVVTKLMRR